MQLVKGKDFAQFAADKLKIWSELTNVKITHNIHGSGEIISVVQRPGYIPIIQVKFNEKIIDYNSNSFLSDNIQLVVSLPITDRIKEWCLMRDEQEKN
jgi:hypothetical protein